MSITKSYCHSYYYLQIAKKLSKVDRDNFEKLARSKEYELLINM